MYARISRLNTWEKGNSQTTLYSNWTYKYEYSISDARMVSSFLSCSSLSSASFLCSGHRPTHPPHTLTAINHLHRPPSGDSGPRPRTASPSPTANTTLTMLCFFSFPCCRPSLCSPAMGLHPTISPVMEPRQTEPPAGSHMSPNALPLSAFSSSSIALLRLTTKQSCPVVRQPVSLPLRLPPATVWSQPPCHLPCPSSRPSESS